MKTKIVFVPIVLLFLFCTNNQAKRFDNSDQSKNADTEIKSIEQEGILCVDSELNIWSYHAKFEIKLPKGYYFSSSVIYNQDSMKIGEVSSDYELLETKLDGEKFIETFRNGGEIVTEENNYGFNNEGDYADIVIIKSDSISTGKMKWYYVIFEMEFEGENEFGFWNAFDFCNIENNRYTGITFYNKDQKDLEISKYVQILSSVEFKY